VALVAALIVVGGVSVVLNGGHSARRGPVVPVPRTYVALGDSFTSGPGVLPQLTSTTTPSAPGVCRRSAANYPSLVARALRLKLTDMSCTSATTAALAHSQARGIAPQLSALRPDTTVVSLGIGGDDLGFSNVVENCVSVTPWGLTRVGWECQSHYTADGVDQLTVATREVGRRVSAALDSIRARSPRAKIYVVGYPDLLPLTGDGCWPKLPFSDAEVGFLRGVEHSLNLALARAASDAHDHFVNMSGPSASHTACSPKSTRWLEPAVTSGGAYPLHPTAHGMAGMARAVASAITQS
jgi:lysophospholipase L1-like esterase